MCYAKTQHLCDFFKRLWWYIAKLVGACSSMFFVLFKGAVQTQHKFNSFEGLLR